MVLLGDGRESRVLLSASLGSCCRCRTVLQPESSAPARRRLSSRAARGSKVFPQLFWVSKAQLRMPKTADPRLPIRSPPSESFRVSGLLRWKSERQCIQHQSSCSGKVDGGQATRHGSLRAHTGSTGITSCQGRAVLPSHLGTTQTLFLHLATSGVCCVAEKNFAA